MQIVQEEDNDRGYMPIDCWRDKMPDGTPVKCGNYESWEQFLALDGEKTFCRRLCPPGYKGKPSQSGSYMRSNKKWMDYMGGVPIYRRKVQGRKVA